MKSIKPKTQLSIKTVAQRIQQLADPIYAKEVARASVVFGEYDAARKSLTKWKEADPRGTPSEMDLRDARLADAQQKFDAAEHKYRTLRGDFGDVDQTALTSSTAISSSPRPLTTSDIAHSFAGLRWPTEDAWKKPLADKPKWLRGCVAIPGSRGRSETHWNPVLIGGALVHSGHAKANNVRAKFQTMRQLQPWLEAWKAYEADNFDQL